MLIFGFGAGAPKDHGPAVPLRCPNCRNDVEYHYAVSRSWFRLFFVPILPYKTRHLLVCPICSRGTTLTSAQGAQAEALVRATAEHRARRLADPTYHEEVERFLADVAGSGPAAAPAHRTVAPGAGHPTSGGATPPGPGSPPPGPAPAATPAGWYPDPYGRAEQRYWDGGRWTDGTIPPT